MVNISDVRDETRERVVELEQPERLVWNLDLRWQHFLIFLSTVCPSRLESRGPVHSQHMLFNVLGILFSKIYWKIRR